MKKFNFYIEMKDPNGEIFSTNEYVENEPTDIEMYQIGNEIKTIFNQSKNIIVQFEVFNNISNTWMCIMSYYGNEDKVIKH